MKSKKSDEESILEIGVFLRKTIEQYVGGKVIVAWIADRNDESITGISIGDDVTPSDIKGLGFDLMDTLIKIINKLKNE
jgi:hypothetical protein